MKRVCLALLGVLFLFINIQAQETVTVLEVRVEAKIVQSETNQLYYIQCVDRCDDWYALADIADLYVGFGEYCAAINHWKLLMSTYYDESFVPFPCVGGN